MEGLEGPSGLFGWTWRPIATGGLHRRNVTSWQVVSDIVTSSQHLMSNGPVPQVHLPRFPGTGRTTGSPGAEGPPDRPRPVRLARLDDLLEAHHPRSPREPRSPPPEGLRDGRTSTNGGCPRVQRRTETLDVVRRFDVKPGGSNRVRTRRFDLYQHRTLPGLRNGGLGKALINRFQLVTWRCWYI